MSSTHVQELLTRRDGLAARLKRARGEMRATALAEQAGWQPSKVSKIEAGKQLPSADDLAVWAGITGVDDVLLEQWQAMLAEALQTRRDWSTRLAGGQKAVQDDYNRIIDECDRYRFFETSFIPRFFQVPGYTRAVLTDVHRRYGGVNDIEEAVAARQASTSMLYDPARQFQLIITEPVMRWRPSALSTSVLRQQLDRLLAVDGLDNVRFGIIPMDQPIEFWPKNSFELYGDVGFAETYVDDGRKLLIDDVRRYDEVMEELWTSAYEGDAARGLILNAIHALKSS